MSKEVDKLGAYDQRVREAEDAMFTRRRVLHPEGGVKLTKEAFQEGADVNTIVRRLIPGTQLPGRQLGPEHFGDFTCAEDFHGALSRVRAAEATFATLPAHVRRACRNDPARLVELLGEPEKHAAELIELGLMKPAEEPAAVGAKPDQGEARSAAGKSSETGSAKPGAGPAS